MSIGNEAAQIPRWTLADRLRKALEHGGISATEMAQYLEVHRNTVSNWIYGHAKPPASAVKLWAMRTGVSYQWLAYGDPSGELPRVDSNHQPADMGNDHLTPWPAPAIYDESVPRSRNAADLLAMRKALPITRRALNHSPDQSSTDQVVTR